MKPLTDIQKAAKGQDCTLRVSGYQKCSPVNTTVLAHAPCRDDGKSFKSPDWWAANSCFSCHSLVDRRAKISGRVQEWNEEKGCYISRQKQRFLTQPEIDDAWLRGIYETQKILREKGLIK